MDSEPASHMKPEHPMARDLIDRSVIEEFQRRRSLVWMSTRRALALIVVGLAVQLVSQQFDAVQTRWVSFSTAVGVAGWALGITWAWWSARRMRCPACGGLTFGLTQQAHELLNPSKCPNCGVQLRPIS